MKGPVLRKYDNNSLDCKHLCDKKNEIQHNIKCKFVALEAWLILFWISFLTIDTIASALRIQVYIFPFAYS